MREWLISFRKNKGMTQAQLAEAVGVVPSYICVIETGKRKVPVWTAKKIAAVLGFDWQRFYEDDNENEKGTNP